MPENKNIPEPVKIALQTMSELQGSLDDVTYADLTKKLPAYAMAYSKQNDDLTIEILKEHIKSGLKPIKKPKRLKQVRDYDAIIEKKLKDNPKPEEDLYFESLANVFDYYINNKDLANIDRMIKKDFGKIEGWGEDYISYENLVEAACRTGNLEMLKYAIDNDKSILDWRLSSDIGCSIAKGYVDFVKYIVDNLDIDLSILESSPYSRHIYEAMENGHEELVKYVLKDNLYNPTLLEDLLDNALDRLNIEMIKYCLDTGLAKGKDWHIEHALLTSITQDKLELTKLIIEELGSDDKNYLRELISKRTVWGTLSGFDTLNYLNELLDSKSNNSLDKFKNIGVHIKNIVKSMIQIGRHRDLLSTAYCLDQLNIPNFLRTPAVKKAKSYYLDWTVKIGIDTPTRVANKSIKMIKKNVFLEISKLFQKEGLHEVIADEYAYNSAAFWQSKDKLLEYLEKWGDPHANQPLHDVSYMVEIPQKRGLNLKAWQDAVMQHGPEMAKLVKFADVISEPLRSDNGQVFSLNKTRAEVAKHSYKQGHKHPKFAEEALKHAWKERSFNNGLKLIHKYIKKYGGEDGRKKLGQIPEIKLDGDLFDLPGYSFHKLKDGDMRGLSLGEYTGCCQHIASVGRDCAEHGYLSENGGFYVLEDKNKAIIGQAWAWRGEDKELVFDSIETLTGRTETSNWNQIFNNISQKLEQDNPSNISRFLVGKGGKTPAINYKQSNKPAKPVDYKGDHRDSNSQYEICSLNRNKSKLGS